jgi:CRISPR-associated endoribonuclease Cas6
MSEVARRGRPRRGRRTECQGLVLVPSRWEVVLSGVDVARVGHAELHREVSGWFDDGAAHWESRKPYRVSRPVAVDGGVSLEVGLLDDGLAGRLLTRASPGAPVRLGGQVARPCRQPRQVAGVGWPDLARPTGARRWTLRFLSPTTIRRGGRTSPWLAPEQVLASVRDEWRAHAPAGVGLPSTDRVGESVWVSDVDGSSRVERLVLSRDRRVTVSGFVGEICYRCDDPAVAAAVDPLFRLAPFCGVGGFAGWGFGQVRLVPARRRS